MASPTYSTMPLPLRKILYEYVPPGARDEHGVIMILHMARLECGHDINLREVANYQYDKGFFPASKSALKPCEQCDPDHTPPPLVATDGLLDE